jgi:hypothetical protein
MTNQHPITPPPELLDKWDNLPISTQEIFVIAAQWGADQELEACCEWLDGGSKIDYATAALLRAARRPKPLSLKAQALDQLESIQCLLDMHELRAETIAAAALRAAADQVVPEFAHDDDDIYSETIQDVRYKLLAIAAELEGVTSR